MKNTNQLILDLISKNASIDEITTITGLSHKQLFYRMNMLKIKGYNFKKKYYYSGDIVYELIKGLNTDNGLKNETTIITAPEDDVFRALLISDIHLGNIKERPDLLYEVYNFCVKKDIHIIINTGDLLDGCLGKKNEKSIYDLEEQINYLLKVYPFDSKIINFICLGNHDFSIVENNGLDLHTVLENKRHDLVPLSYGRSFLNIKNDQILLKHENEVYIKGIKKNVCNLTFEGHHHISKVVKHDASTKLFVPSLSDISIGEYSQFPSMVLVNLSFMSGLFHFGNFEQFIFVNKSLFKVNENEFHLLNGKKISSKISNEEKRNILTERDIVEILKKNNFQCSDDPIKKKSLI